MGGGAEGWELRSQGGGKSMGVGEISHYNLA